MTTPHNMQQIDRPNVWNTLVRDLSCSTYRFEVAFSVFLKFPIDIIAFQNKPSGLSIHVKRAPQYVLQILNSTRQKRVNNSDKL